MQKAKLFNINWRDALHGLITAVLGAFTTTAYDWVSNGQFPHSASDFKTIGGVAVAAGLSYIVKNVFSNSAGNFAQGESKAPTTVVIPQPESNKEVITETKTIITNKP